MNNNTEELVFCISCGEMVHMECDPLCGHVQYVPVRDENGVVMGVDVEFCDMQGGYAFVPPPAVQENWIDFVVEPGDEVVIEKSYYFDPELPEEAIYLLRGEA